MDVQSQKRLTRQLRKDAGRWLRELREKRGLSQRELAKKVDAEYYTFISQLEHGRGFIPQDHYMVWADALEIERGEFVQRLTSYYDPKNSKIDHSLPKRLKPTIA